MSDLHWQFWIDVGGTFTDCLARRPDGQLLRHKLLSSGITKGIIAAGSTADCLVDLARRDDPPDFWRGAQLRLLSSTGAILSASQVERFESQAGRLSLAAPLRGFSGPGQPYEILTEHDAPLLIVRYLLRLGPDEPLPPLTIKLGTTQGTNALLTRRGAKCAFVTTKGFADVLRIGYQNRPKLFELAIEKPAPLYVDSVEIEERVTAEGAVLIPVDPDQVRETLVPLYRRGIESLAICLLHAYRFPDHELVVEQIAREVGFRDISRSSQVAPFIKIVSRGDTTVVDAYLNPVLRSYVQRLRDAMDRGGTATPARTAASVPHQFGTYLRFLTSAGGLVTAENFRGKDSILSGPAGGVVGFSRVAAAAGFSRAIGFDMGGTSTDVSRFDGQYEREYETEKAGVRIVTPMLAIETVAAGGGSICWFDGVKLCVGPDSAGADPGPACYGRGGPLTVTDLNFFLGRIPAQYFPFPLTRAAVESRLQELRTQIENSGAKSYRLVELANGLLQVANSKMAKAIRSISVAKGYDPRDYVLVPFGGAAGQHACAIAEELGINQLLCHPDAGLLSAYGIGLADVTRHTAEGVYRPYTPEILHELSLTFERLEATAVAQVEADGVPHDRIRMIHSLDLRYVGTDASMNIAKPSDGDYHAEFTAQHQRLYGYVHPGRALEVVAARVEAIGHSAEQLSPSRRIPGEPAEPQARTFLIVDGREQSAEVYRRDTIQPGQTLAGPAILLERTSTTVVDSGWRAEILTGGELLLQRTSSIDREVDGSKTSSQAHRVHSAAEQGDSWAEADPVLLEIFNNHFAAIAEQMGITLRSTSSSVNVKERLDFSCAVFTSRGDLVVNAPHIPVHLGAMSETVKAIIADNPELRPGDVFVTNDPYRGGSHLPDVTVVTPIFHTSGGGVIFFTASRAHHAEIGGISPGSMPAFSCTLAEEGVLIRNFRAVAAGESRMEQLRELLSSGPYPSRSVHENLYDISAQIAANQQGSRNLLRLVERYGWRRVAAYMGHIQAAAEQKMRQALSRLTSGPRQFVDYLDDGSPIAVRLDITGDAAQIDFSGTGAVLAGNLNANRAIVTAAVMYCLRCLIDEDIPLNQGVLAPVHIVLPECLLNPPQRDSPEQCAAVAGGNVETSQRVVDVLLGALGLAAASQGTMNNLLFGDGTFGYYETICGGAGATAQRTGADAVHTHMTNTRLTDPEVLEHRYPVRLQEFSIRRGSGGAGRQQGGAGVFRCLEFLKSVQVSILSQRRGPYPPYGTAGGQPGTLGRNTLHHADGTIEQLPGIARFTAAPGDRLVIETPGGGGYGSPEPNSTDG